MAAEIYRVEIPIIVEDHSEAPIEQARERVNRFEKEARKRNEMIRKHFENMARLKIEPVMRIRDKLTAGVLKADRLVKMLGAEQAAPVLTAQDKVSAVVLRINQLLDAMDKNRVDVLADLKGPLMQEIAEARTALVALSKVQAAPVAELRGKLYAQLTRAMTVARQLDQVRAEPQATLRERVMTKAREIMGTLRGLTSRAWKITLGVKDTAFGAIRRLTGMLTSPLGLLGAGAGIYGLGKATVGAAMTWETQAVSMEHWLKGNKALAQEVTGWLEQFAEATPFEMGDLFLAMTRAIGISEGDVKMAERMVKLAADMAGLTPGKTVRDAMEALADAQVGEFERMKEFQMKMTQEQYKALGGWAGFLKQAEARFAGGAEELSRTSLGRISTITDNIKTMFRQVGVGVLQAMSLRLEAIVRWFKDNKATVERWKNDLVRFGREGAEALLSRFEGAFRYIRVRYLDNPEFQQLDFAGKVKFVIDDLTTTFDTWWNGPGGEKVRDLGSKLGSSLISSMDEAAMTAVLDHPLLALLLGAYVGLQAPGPIQLKAVVAISIAAAPWVMRILNWISEHSPLNPEPKIRQQNQAWQWYEEQRTTLPTNEPLFKGQTIGPARHALGGIFNQPHIGLIAETGPEVVIPLASRFRNRALDLWQATGRYIGAPVAISAPGSGTTINIDINLSGLIGQVSVNSRESLDNIADQIAGMVGEKLKKTFHNLPR